MKNLERILAISGLSLGLMLGGCDASVGGDGDATGDDAVADASTGGDATGTDTTNVVPDGTTGDTGPGQTVFKFATIDGTPAQEPDCNATTSPGPDIDAVALWRQMDPLDANSWQLVGVAKPGTAVYKAGLAPLCPEKTAHLDPTAVEGSLDADESQGYIGLRQGSLEFQFGACQTSTNDVKACGGTGAVVDILPGDEIDVFEVDSLYQTKTACENNNATQDKALCGQGPQAGMITKACKCLPEDYEVLVHEVAGGAGQGVILGAFKGTTSQIKVVDK